VYVTPAEGMMIRAGQHVDPQGKVYHPYLVGWAEFWDVSMQPGMEEMHDFSKIS
jgi:ESCRT-I complex subunit TSG101